MTFCLKFCEKFTNRLAAGLKRLYRFRSSAIVANCCNAASRSSAISAAITSGYSQPRLELIPLCVIMCNVIKSFRCPHTEQLFHGRFAKKLPHGLQRIAKRKLDQLHAAATLDFLH